MPDDQAARERIRTTPGRRCSSTPARGRARRMRWSSGYARWCSTTAVPLRSDRRGHVHREGRRRAAGPAARGVRAGVRAGRRPGGAGGGRRWTTWTAPRSARCTRFAQQLLLASTRSRPGCRRSSRCSTRSARRSRSRSAGPGCSGSCSTTTTIAEPLLLALAVGVELKHLRSLARAFGNDWDLIERPGAVASSRRGSSMPDVAPLVAEAARAGGARSSMHATTTTCCCRGWRRSATWATSSATAADPESRLALLGRVRTWTFGLRAARRTGRTVEIARRATVPGLVQRGRAMLVDELLDACLRPLAHWLADRVLESARAAPGRGTAGVPRPAGAGPRPAAPRRRRARGAAASATSGCCWTSSRTPTRSRSSWRCGSPAGRRRRGRLARTSTVPAGRLFVVGDPKQSIYRFRRADIGTYLAAQERIGDDGDT